MNYTHYKNILQSNVHNKTVLCSIVALLVALCIFQAGIFVGYHKASFSYGAGDNFHHMFGYPEHREMMGRGDMPMMAGFPGDEFTSAYGTMGTIVKIALPTIVVAGTDKVEKVVVVNEKTIVRQFRENLKNSDLKVGDAIIVIGEPTSSSQIEAKLIRVMPSVSTATTTLK